MNNTLIIYDNANTKINNVLNKISEVIVDSKLHQVSDELKNIDNYSNIAVTIAMEDENNFKLYKSLRDYIQPPWTRAPRREQDQPALDIGLHDAHSAS